MPYLTVFLRIFFGYLVVDLQHKLSIKIQFRSDKIQTYNVSQDSGRNPKTPRIVVKTRFVFGMETLPRARD